MEASIFIAGSGGIGQAAGLILAESEVIKAKIYYGDISQEALDRTLNFVKSGATRASEVNGILMPLEGSNSDMDNILASCDIILDCLPGSQAPRMAGLAKKHHCHYANLTEYVQETKEIMEVSKDADTGFVLQTGLAPGFINILAHQLYLEFSNEYQVEMADKMQMKVGAISRHAPAPHFYAFTWSPIGVATEYMKDAEVVQNFQKVSVPALSGLERIIIDGQVYEDNYTSGGAADLPDYFAGKIKDLNYKTLRFPGHYQWVKETIANINDSDNKIKVLEQTMLNNIARVEDDIVIVYASVEGKDKNGVLHRKERSYKIAPSKVGHHQLRAIQTTTAAPLCEVAYILLSGKYSGTVLQSQIEPKAFLNGPFVSAIYGKY